VTADADRSPSLSAEVRPLSHDRVGWGIAAVLVVLVGALAALIDDRPGIATLVVVTAIPVAALAATFAATLRRGSILAAGALGIAVTPAALAAVAVGAQWGAVTVLAACGAVALAFWGRDAPVVATWVVVATVVGIGAWFVSTHDQLTSPTWGQATKRTGELLWSSVGSLGATQIVPATGWLIWWVAAGLVCGVALIAGAVRLAAVIPLATAVMVVAAWVIIRWRGDVDMSGGTWIVASAVAFVGASVRPDRDAGRRIGVTLLVVAVFIWTVAIVHLARN
jgi:hypothetical protein